MKISDDGMTLEHVWGIEKTKRLNKLMNNVGEAYAVTSGTALGERIASIEAETEDTEPEDIPSWRIRGVHY